MNTPQSKNPLCFFLNLRLLITAFVLVLSSGACNREEILNLKPEIQAIKGETINMVPEDPCTGSLRYSVGYQIVPFASLNHDVGIQINPMPISGLGDGCDCVHKEYCITFQFPQSSISLATVQEPGNENVYNLEFDGQGGYVGHNSSLPDSPMPHYGLQQTNMLEHKICVGTPGIVLIKFPNGLPPNFNASTAVIRVTGLCIVDHLSNPSG